MTPSASQAPEQTQSGTHMLDVKIHTPDSLYKIHIGSGLLKSIAPLLPFDMAGRKAFLITDNHVSGLYAAGLAEQLKALGAGSAPMLILPPGEQSKSFEELQRILTWMLDNGLNRQSVVFAVGGGVVGDIAGLAAALAMRGVACIQIPTTLLAQVDSSVGGKTAIDVPQGKNMIGAFHQPAAVICDTDTLTTLPEREIKAGYAEILKYGLIGDLSFFIWLEANGADVLAGNPDALARAVEISCRKKAHIVAADEKESGTRALLNFGHTFGHALERIAGYDESLLHGEAVAIGMVMALHLSVRLGGLDENECDRAMKHMRALGLPLTVRDIHPVLDCGAQDILAAMQSDKKATDAGLRFILLKEIGEAFIADNVDAADVLSVIEDSIQGN